MTVNRISNLENLEALKDISLPVALKKKKDISNAIISSRTTLRM
jgi:hypothetical protein